MEQPDGGPSGFFPAGFEPVTHQDMSADNRQLFFAKISKNAGEDEIKLLFSEYGNVLDVILFQSSQGSGTSKGCGLVTMSTHEEAAAAIAALHGKFAWSNRDPAMVVTWMDVALQDPARLHNIQSGRPGPKPLGLARGTARPLELVADGADTPPVGCDPDAVKLFVGNIPLSYTEEQLLPLFQQIGPVVELVVVRNKLNSLSKGCAFVWYASREHAETAITALNLQHMLPDVTGQQHRPLVVRKARTGHMLGGLVQKTSAEDLRPGGAALGGSGPLRTGLPNRLLGGHNFAAPPLSHPLLGNRAINTNPYLGQASVMNPNAQLINQRYGMAAAPMLTTQNAPVHFNMRPAGLHPQQLHAQHHMLGSGGGYATVGHYHGGMQIGHQQLELLHQGQPITVHTLPNGTKYVQTAPAGPQHQYQVVGPGQHHQPQYQYILDTGAQQQTHIQHLGLAPDLLEQYMPMQAVQAVQMPGMDSGSSQSHGTVMALDTSQLALVNDHLFSIQSSSSCALMVSPGGPGTFNLLLSGERQQVERAQLMVASLLSQDAGSKGALS